jgi:hypothetical protein
MAPSGGPSLGVEDSHKDNIVASPCIHQAYALSILMHHALFTTERWQEALQLIMIKKDCDTSDRET